jgi:hypothetical protein
MAAATGAPVSVRSVEFDLVTKSEGNERFASKKGMFAKANRIANQRKAVTKALAKLGAPPAIWITPAGAAPSYTEPNRIELRCTRIAPGSLDVHDNLQVAFKGPIDAVAEWIGVKDNDPRLTVHRCEQEKSAGVSTQGACPVCLAAPQAACNLTVPGKVQSGCHAARRTPWRVRIEVEDRTPGVDRAVVLASEIPSTRKKNGQGRKRPKATPAGDPGEEVAARLLVACPLCMVPVGERCRDLPGRPAIHGVHTRRAIAAGILTTDTSRITGAPRTGVRKMARQVSHAPAGQARLPLVRCYVALPYLQPRCACWAGDSDTWQGTKPGGLQSRCESCDGSGIVGPLSLRTDARLDGLSPPPSVLYAVPEPHRARWGKTITLYRRSMKAAGLGIITVYALKGR